MTTAVVVEVGATLVVGVLMMLVVVDGTEVEVEVVVGAEVDVELDDVFNVPPHAASATPVKMMIANRAAFMCFFNRLPFVAMLAIRHPRTRF